jgi:hypothetical protein
MRGYRLLDEVGTKVGRVEEIWGDWLLVRLGYIADIFTIVPAQTAHVAGGYVWVPYRVDMIFAAAPLAKAGRPSERLERELRMHYGLRQLELARG